MHSVQHGFHRMLEWRLEMETRNRVGDDERTARRFLVQRGRGNEFLAPVLFTRVRPAFEAGGAMTPTDREALLNVFLRTQRLMAKVQHAVMRDAEETRPCVRGIPAQARAMFEETSLGRGCVVMPKPRAIVLEAAADRVG